MDNQTRDELNEIWKRNFNILALVQQMQQTASDQAVLLKQLQDRIGE